ncbi:SCO2400 family protein [Streptomyces aurantiogriseus]|uniref:Uncharacterized protein n=1 Tax=Streptomyces aurantiogriseus TaxID=66870 RepID=A0A918BT98_9ACTN|nr:hypothetical protein [Streptomyces aurantiogriseus]GGQ91511.1 hypothetical protein GCM10010251_02400 [Streptomyces aurantiogriseus]
MDYCSSCHRHLNGALVCPGCGAYAPDIAPATADGRIVPAPVSTVVLGAAAAAAPKSTAWDSWQDGRPGDEADAAALRFGGEETAPPSDPSVDLDDAPTAPQGRAARRRQLARWKKNQRRAVVATAVALVGGGLTLASMDRQSGDRTQAATAPEDPGGSAVEEQTAQDSRPTTTQPDTHRSSPTAPARTPSSDTPRRQYANASLPTTPSHAQPDAAAAPRTAAVSGPQPQSTAGSSGGTVSDGTDSGNGSHTANSAAAQRSAATATDATNPGTTGPGTTDPGASQASPAPAATSPSEVCLLVLCLG